jgi:hypothetical protein
MYVALILYLFGTVQMALIADQYFDHQRPWLVFTTVVAWPAVILYAMVRGTIDMVLDR